MKSKKLELIIKSCYSCPHNIEIVFDDVGFGCTLYRCEKLKKSETITREEAGIIRKDCPLNDA